MQNKNKGNMVIWVIIVLLVIVFLVYITFNKGSGLGNTTANTLQGVEENQNMENTKQVEGVKITVLQEGSGDVAKSGDTVAMNYTGKLLDGQVFDSNVDPKFGHVEPFIFTIDAGMVIKGWDLGVSGMKIGEKRNLTIEPAYAYGERGAAGVIPPNATLSFDVELLAIKK